MLKEIGELLRSTREKKGLSLKQIFNETKIHEKKLRAIEEGDPSAFEGEIYLKGALRKYAQAVGIDPLEVMSLYEQSKKQLEVSEKGKEAKTEDKKEKTFSRKKKSVPFKEKKPLSVVAISWIIIIGIIVGGSIWYSYRQAAENDATDPFYSIFPSEEPKEEPFADEENNNEEEFPLNEDIYEENYEEEIELVLDSTNDSEAIYLLRGVEEKEIEMDFNARCWFRVEQNGELVEETILEEGEIFTLGDSGETSIRLGNPPAVGVTVNGEQIENLSEITTPYNIIIKRE